MACTKTRRTDQDENVSKSGVKTHETSHFFQPKIKIKLANVTFPEMHEQLFISVATVFRKLCGVALHFAHRSPHLEEMFSLVASQYFVKKHQSCPGSA